VVVALLIAGSESIAAKLQTINLESRIEHAIGIDMYALLGVIAFALMGLMLYRTAMKKHDAIKV